MKCKWAVMSTITSTGEPSKLLLSSQIDELPLCRCPSLTPLWVRHGRGTGGKGGGTGKSRIWWRSPYPGGSQAPSVLIPPLMVSLRLSLPQPPSALSSLAVLRDDLICCNVWKLPHCANKINSSLCLFDTLEMCRVTQTGFQLERAKKWDGCQGTGPTADYVILAGKGPVGKNTKLFRKEGNSAFP